MINAALVSFGMSGRVFHAPFLNSNPSYNLIGSWERTKKSIQQFYPGTKSYDSYEALLQDDAVDLVIVNSPNDTHFEYAKRALLSGKHVVVEKAFTVTSNEAFELDIIASKMNKQIAVYQNRRFDADFLTIQKLINEGQLGEFLDVQISFERYRTTLSPKVHKEKPTPGAGLLMDLGPHLMDQALLLSGKPDAIFADIRATRKTSLVDDYFMMLLYYPTHRITLTSGMVFMQQLPGYKIYGTKGCFIKYRSDVQESDLIAGKIPNTKNWGKEAPENYGTLSSDNNGVISTKIIPSLPGNYGNFYEQMADAIVNNAPVPVSAIEGAHIIQMLEAARESSKTKKVITIQ